MRWTQKQFDEFQERRATGAPAPSQTQDAKSRLFALGRLPAGTMNKTEAAYEAHLCGLWKAEEILWYKFEAIKLRLADNTFYTCDFAVLPASGILEMHEVKGGLWLDDAKVKIKVAASLYPFKFISVKARAKKHGGGWERTEF